MKRMLLTILLLSLAATAVTYADGTLSLDYQLMNTVLRTRTINTGGPYWGYAVSGTAGLSYRSTGNAKVKGELSFDLNFPEMDLSGTGTMIPLITLEKAYIKARFPEFRLTAGKTRLSWGDGFIFNSGDIIFGSITPYVDLTASEVRSETEWMVSVNVPLGRFSFVEALVVPPETSTEKMIGDLTGASAGGRIYTTIGGLKVESGYIYKGTDAYHQVYFGLQGNFGADWYAAGSVAIPSPGSSLSAEELGEESFNLSFGLFYLQQLSRISSMAFRLEGLVMPFHRWEESDPDDPGTLPTYGLLLYPEVSYIPSDTVNLSLRSILSPIDLSAQMTAGITWNVFQGFSLIGYTTCNLGDSTDTFAWNKDAGLWNTNSDYIDGFALSVGLSYIY